MKFIIMHLYPPSCYFLHLRPKYLP
jgi:hypothetical protein